MLDLVSRTTPLIVETVDRNEQFKAKPFAVRENVKTLIVYALRWNERQLGILFINYTERYYRFTEDELGDFQLFADLASVVVRRAQVQERHYKRLLASSSQEEVLNTAVAEVAKIMAAECCDLVLRRADGVFEVVAYTGWGQDIRGMTLEAGYMSHSAYTLSIRKPVAVRDFRTESRFSVPQFVLEEGIRSGISACLFLGDALCGTLLVHTRTERDFEPESEKHLIQALANQTSAALELVRRLEHVEWQRARFRAMWEASEALTQASRGLKVEPVLQQLLKQAVQFLVRAVCSQHCTSLTRTLRT